jgi:hypothetical protein
VIAQEIRKIWVWEYHEPVLRKCFYAYCKNRCTTCLINFRSYITHSKKSKVFYQNQHLMLFPYVCLLFFSDLRMGLQKENPWRSQERRLYKMLGSKILSRRKWYYSSSYLKSYWENFIPNENPWKAEFRSMTGHP